MLLKCKFNTFITFLLKVSWLIQNKDVILHPNFIYNLKLFDKMRNFKKVFAGMTVAVALFSAKKYIFSGRASEFTEFG